MRRILKNSLFYIYLGVLFFGYIIADSLNKLDVYIGIAVGIMLALIELVISSNKIDKLDQKNIELAKAKNELDNYKKMGVIRILENKDDTSDYAKRIDNVKEKLFVMGNTAHKFMDDFVNVERESESKRILLKVMSSRNIEVKLLLAKKKYLSENRQEEFDIVQQKMVKVSKQYKNFQVKYFDHEPTQSIFLFDDECFIGPIFKDLASHDTPALHMKCGGSFTKKYMNYFDAEWQIAEEINLNE